MESFVLLANLLLMAFLIWIYWKQTQIFNNQLKLALYEKRIEIYFQLQHFLRIIANNEIMKTEDIVKFSREVNTTSKFLFASSESILKEIDLIYNRGLSYHSEMSLNNNLKVIEIQKWAGNEFGILFELFKKSLEF